MNRFTLPTNSMDPCSIGPLTCGPMNCQTATNDEEMKTTLFSVASQKARSNMSAFRGPIPRSNTNLSSASITPLEHLKDRVSDFQSRGWLSQQEFRQYKNLLETTPKPTEYVQNELVEELDLLEDKMTGGKVTLSKQIRKSLLTPRTSVQRNAADDKENSSLVEPPLVRSDEPSGDTTKKIDKVKNRSIVDAKDLANQLSEGRMEEMFVETCFFARLGFVQPPCCLQCSYREALKEAAPKSSCGRLVVWRRDAKHVLHPHYMKNNTVFVQCHVARQLLAGKLVDSHKWDEVNKVLLFPHPAKVTKGW
jgi:hypothetical protein